MILRLWRPRATAASGRPRSRTCSGHCQWTTYGCTIMTSVLSIAGFSPLSSRILHHADQSPLYPRGDRTPSRRSTFVPRSSTDPEPQRVGRLRDEGRPGPGELVAGGGRHPGAEVLPPGRRAAGRRVRVAEEGVPEWLQRQRARAADAPTGGETDSRQVFRRLAGCWTYWGWKGGYFSSEADARAFYDEICYMLAAQMAAPNSPQWFNTGLHWAYGIEGPAAGALLRRSADAARSTRSTSAYERPAPHACFIQSVSDDLVNEGGIMDLWVREARIFKYGSRHRHRTSPRCAARANRSPAAASRPG